MFDDISYQTATGHFQFSYNVNKLGKPSKDEPLNNPNWTVSSHVLRSQYYAKQQKTEMFVVTDKIKRALENDGIDCNTPNLRSQLITSQSKSLHQTMMYCFNAILAMRVTNPNAEKGSDENDFILSPVYPFFDSRKSNKLLPENGDANGAYNIARKGIMLINRINDEVSWNKERPDLLIRANQWRNFCQNAALVAHQKSKLD